MVRAEPEGLQVAALGIAALEVAAQVGPADLAGPEVIRTAAEPEALSVAEPAVRRVGRMLKPVEPRGREMHHPAAAHSIPAGRVAANPVKGVRTRAVRTRAEARQQVEAVIKGLRVEPRAATEIRPRLVRSPIRAHRMPHVTTLAQVPSAIAT